MRKYIINVLLIVVIFPLLFLALHVLNISQDSYFVPGLLLHYFSNTLFLMLGTGTMTFIMGTGLALIVNFFNFPCRRIFKNLLILPLSLPIYIVALVYSKLVDFSHLDSSRLSSLCTAICVMSFCLYPYVYMVISSRIHSLLNTVAIARTLGKKPIEIFVNLVMPMARPAIVASIFMVLMEVVADFGAVQFFSIQTITTGIYRNYFLLNNYPASSALTLVLLSFMFLLIYCEKISGKKRQYCDIAHANSFETVQWQLSGLKAFFAILFCITPILFGFVLPVITLFSWSFKATLNINKIGILLYNTVSIAFIATVVITTLALIFAYSLRVKEVNSILARIAFMGYAMPGVTAAIAILGFLAFFGNTINFFIEHILCHKSNIVFIGTAFALIYSYTFRFISISFCSIEAHLSKVPKEFDLTVKILGKSYIEILELYAPMISNGIFTAFILTFIEIIKELPATLILRSFNFETFATKIYLLVEDERYYDAALPSLMMIVLCVVSMLILMRLIDGKNLHRSAGSDRLKCLCDICIGIKNEC